MKNVSFSDMKSFYFGNVKSSSKGQEMSNGESFLQVFDKTQGNPETVKQETVDVKTNDADSIQNHAKIQKKNSSEPIRENKEEVSAEAVEEAAVEMKEKIAEVLGVSVEEVESAMEVLGISVVDLLNNDVLTQVVLALNPQADALQIMTDENLFADLKALMEFAQGIKNQMCEQYQMSEEELKGVMDALKTVTLEQSVNAEGLAETVPADVLEVQETEETQVRNPADMKGSEKTDVNEVLTNKTASVETVPVEVRSSRQNASSHSESGNENGQNMFKEFYNQLSEAVNKVEAQTITYGTGGQEIIRQITEYIKIHVKPETTEMELQLHPASLGSVKVQIASTGGVLTAIFTTENETVKAALESQLIQLKDNFEQQGLKVESVEVNVSTQGFERSLDQQESEQNSFEEEKNKKANRRIKLSDMDENGEVSLEELTEEDKVVADMMIRNGNTVDYTV